MRVIADRMDTSKHKTLGENVIPLNYDLTFDTNLKTFAYSGTETVSVKIRKPASAIKMNAGEIKIQEASVTLSGKKAKARISYNVKEQEVTLRFPSKLSGRVLLSLRFTGKNNDGLYGFYRSKYTNRGKTGYILTTQFEPADARHAFPCFDEPEFKATFDVHIILDKSLDALSNMPVKKTEPRGKNRKIVTFNTTPRMSPYLLYLGVGKYEYLNGSLGGLKLRIVTVPGKIKYAKLAMEFAKKSVAYYQGYFRIKYPLPKLDLIGIPDFSAGAMENWGAITFREIDLLGDRKVSSIATMQRIASVVAHEIAHQWFGDLVTMHWWNDLWLNESFATFMSYKAVDSAYPEWDSDIQYVLDNTDAALAADQLNTTHPINVFVNEPGEVNQVFDDISYAKGGSLLGMIEDYAGPETFRKGLHAYLSAHKYGNATTYDLWNSLDRSAKRDRKRINVGRVAGYWVDQPGYPVVNVKQGADNTLDLEQERFLLLEREKSSQVWPIPLHYDIGGTGGFMLFDKKKAKLKSQGGAYAKLNLSQKGIYRVSYPEDQLRMLGSLIKEKKLAPLDAFGVENDLFSLARACKISLSGYLDFAERYCFDSAYPLNESLSSHLSGLMYRFYGERAYSRIVGLSSRYHRRLLDQLGWEKKKGERSVTTMLRSQTIAALGTCGDKDVVAKCVELFEGASKGIPVNPDLRSAVYRTCAWNGDKETFKAIKGMFKKAELPEDRIRLQASLGGFRESELLKTALEFSMSGAVRYQDIYITPANVASNPVGRDLIWEWTRDNWKRLMKDNAPGTHLLKAYVVNLRAAQDTGTLSEIRNFFSKKENVRNDIKKDIAQTLEGIEINIRFVGKNS